MASLLSSSHLYDVLIIGGGPSGSSTAYWLAEAGWDVAVVERKHFPREKTCGDGLTPRAVRQIADMGLEDALHSSHRYGGLRAVGFGHQVEMAWPEHPAFPNYGYTITRFDLDGLVAGHAEKFGANVFQETEALDIVPGASNSSGLPRIDGIVVKPKGATEPITLSARYVVVADGSNSRIGRALGAKRDRDQPMGLALRGYYNSPRHDDDFIESHLDIRDEDGAVVPGYGWIFPMGDGRVNVGVGVLSTDHRWKGLNTGTLMDAFVKWAPKSWELTPENCCGPATGGKLPMGMAVGPRVGANVVVVGDASGSINPFNGEGISYGYETGRLAAAVIGEALAGGGDDALALYEERLSAAYGLYYRVARKFVRIISHPEILRASISLGLRSEVLMSELLRLMANLMRPEPGAAEVAYRAVDAVARMLGVDDIDALPAAV